MESDPKNHHFWANFESSFLIFFQLYGFYEVFLGHFDKKISVCGLILCHIQTFQTLLGTFKSQENVENGQFIRQKLEKHFYWANNVY